MSAVVRVHPAGARGVLIELADGVPAAGAAAALRAAFGQRLQDVVAGHATVLALGAAELPATADLIGAIEARPVAPDAVDLPLVELNVVYDGEDLADLAGTISMDAAELSQLHAAGEFRVAFLGMGGFPYLVGGDPRLTGVARRATPRTRVRAGSVAVAAGYTGIYPRATPGGWWLIGHTDAVVFDPARAAPALLTTGQRVRLRSVG